MSFYFVDEQMVKKVVKYRKKGLSFREISKLTGKNISNVHRWYNIGIGKLKARRQV